MFQLPWNIWCKLRGEALTSGQRSALSQATSCKNVKPPIKPPTSSVAHLKWLQAEIYGWSRQFYICKRIICFWHNQLLRSETPCRLCKLVLSCPPSPHTHSHTTSFPSNNSLSEHVSSTSEGADDWFIFLYLIAGDEQQRVFQVVGVGRESVAVC